MLIILSKSIRSLKNGLILKITAKIVENEKNVAVLHIQDACFDLTISEYCDKLIENKIEVYALKADCEARGLIEKLAPKVKVIDYRGWVELAMTKHDKIVSWTS